MTVFFKKITFKTLALFVSVFLIQISGFSINDPFDKEDQQKLDEAEELNQSAQKFLDQADELFSEIALLQNENKDNSKKITKLKVKAIDYQIKAFEQQKEANILTYQVYSKYINQAKNKKNTGSSSTVRANLLIEQAEKLFYQAEMLRMDAYAFDKNQHEDKRDNLKEAQEFERLGLEKQYEAYQILSDENHNGELSSLVTEPGDEKIVINEALLKEYLNYLAKTNETTTFEKIRSIAFSDSVSSEKLRKQWDEYIYNYSAPVVQAEDEKSIEPETQTGQLAIAEADEITTTSESVEEKVDKQQEEKHSVEKTGYKVRIAADKKPVSQATLQKIYSSNKDVEVIEQNGWVDYSVGNFKTFEDADAFRSQLGNADAFIVEIKEDEIISEPDDKSGDDKTKKNLITETKDEWVFKVQIAASKHKLSGLQIASIYNGNENVEEIIEDGWYKYSVGRYSGFDQAETKKQKINVNDAFVVSYHNGIKVPLYMAIRGITPEKRTTRETDKIVFKVQIAADTKPLSSSKLHDIYSGYHQIESYTEDGWYKYSIGELETFDDANQLRISSNIKGAFIVAFKNGKKINVLEAKKAVRDCYTPGIINDWQSDNNRIVFRVQIAASKNELTPLQLKQKYCGEQNVYLSYEDQWYKYSVGNFSIYDDANTMRKNIRVDGAFVVAYQFGKKLDIKKAINKSN